jgi:hypothetical protein
MYSLWFLIILSSYYSIDHIIPTISAGYYRITRFGFYTVTITFWLAHFHLSGHLFPVFCSLFLLLFYIEYPMFASYGRKNRKPCTNFCDVVGLTVCSRWYFWLNIGSFSTV